MYVEMAPKHMIWISKQTPKINNNESSMQAYTGLWNFYLICALFSLSNVIVWSNNAICVCVCVDEPCPNSGMILWNERAVMSTNLKIQFEVVYFCFSDMRKWDSMDPCVSVCLGVKNHKQLQSNDWRTSVYSGRLMNDKSKQKVEYIYCTIFEIIENRIGNVTVNWKA